MPRPLPLILSLLLIAACGAAPPRTPQQLDGALPTAVTAAARAAPVVATALPTAAPVAATAAAEILLTLPEGGADSLIAATAGAPFEVPLGGSFAVGASGLTVDFSAVPEDSRCPDGAQCLWQGRAVVAIEVAAADGSVERLTLAIPGDLTPDAPAALPIGPYTLRLLDLAPYPALSAGAPAPYVATLVLEQP